MSIAQISLPVTIQSGEWKYDDNPFTDIATSVTGDKSYTITRFNGSTSETESATTTTDIGHAELTVENLSSTETHILVSDATGISHLRFPLGTDPAIFVVALQTSGATPEWDLHLSEGNDPKFSIKPVKIPPNVTTSGTRTPSVTWNGTGWSPSTVIANIDEDLQILNTSGASVRLTIGNSQTLSEQSTLTITLPNTATGLTLTFGAGPLFHAGFLEVAGSTVQASLSVV